MKIFPKHEEKEWYTMGEVFGRLRYNQWWYKNTIGGRVAFFFLRFTFIPERIRNLWFGIRMTAQKIVRGFSDDEVCGLHSHIAAFVYPRLVMFRDTYSAICPGILLSEMFPSVLEMTEEQEKLANGRWLEILDSMIYAFEYIHNRSDYRLTEEETVRIEDGLYLFSKYFHCLWN